MEWLKFAFDTLIVGALALPWLWLFTRIFFQRGSGGQDELTFPIIAALPEPVRQTALGVLVVAIGYVLGSAVSRISSDFFNDDDVLASMPNESSIRHGVYLHEYCDMHSVLTALLLPTALVKPSGKAVFCDDGTHGVRLLDEFFRLQESKLLLEGEEKLGRLREFHDQIEILRGATLNGAILFALSWFGLCALYRARVADGDADNKVSISKTRRLVKFASYTPALACLLVGLWQLQHHFARQHQPSEVPTTYKATPNPFETHRDPPLAEAVLVLLGLGGLGLRFTDDNPRLFRNVCLIAAVLSVITYGAWWWTEVEYDQQVIHSFPSNLQLIPNSP